MKFKPVLFALTMSVVAFGSAWQAQAGEMSATEKVKKVFWAGVTPDGTRLNYLLPMSTANRAAHEVLKHGAKYLDSKALVDLRADWKSDAKTLFNVSETGAYERGVHAFGDSYFAAKMASVPWINLIEIPGAFETAFRRQMWGESASQECRDYDLVGCSWRVTAAVVEGAGHSLWLAVQVPATLALNTAGTAWNFAGATVSGIGSMAWEAGDLILDTVAIGVTHVGYVFPAAIAAGVWAVGAISSTIIAAGYTAFLAIEEAAIKTWEIVEGVGRWTYTHMIKPVGHFIEVVATESFHLIARVARAALIDAPRNAAFYGYHLTLGKLFWSAVEWKTSSQDSSSMMASASAYFQKNFDAKVIGLSGVRTASDKAHGRLVVYATGTSASGKAIEVPVVYVKMKKDDGRTEVTLKMTREYSYLLHKAHPGMDMDSDVEKQAAAFINAIAK